MIAAYRELMMQAVYERRLLGSLWLTWSLLALALLLALGFGVWLHQWRAGVVIGDMLLGVVGLLWWGNMVRISVQQNMPSHACLVPQLRRRLMRAVACSFVAGVLLVSAIAALAIGHFGYLLCALSMLFPFVLLQQRYSWLSILPSVVILSALSWLKAPWLALVQFASGFDEWVVSVLLLCVIAELGVLAMRAAFPQGGDAHANWRAALVQRQHRQKGEAAVLEARGIAAHWPGWVAAWRTLGVAVKRPGGVPPSAARSTQYGLGISLYASALTVPAMALIGWLFAVFPGMLSDKLTMGLSVWNYLVQLMVTMAVPSALHSIVTAISQRTGEQSLMRLAPSMPAAPALNAMLARLMIRGFVLLWGGATLCQLVAARISEGHWVLDGPMALVLVLPLPFLLMVLRNYAAMPPQAAALGGYSLLAMPALGLAWLLNLQYPALSGGVALLVLVLSLLVLRWRWLAMVQAPVAFPAGRLA